MIDASLVTALENLVNKGAATTPIPGREDIIILPMGRQIADLEEYANQPRRVVASPRLIDRGSFSQYVNRFKTSDSIITGYLGNGSFVASIDYHTPPTGDNAINPSWSDHQPRLVLKKSVDFQKLLANNDKKMSQTEFAEFLEDVTHCVIEPDTATLKELVLKFEAVRNVTFKSAPNRVNGNVIFEYKDENQVVGKVAVPEVIGFAVAPYEASDPISLAASLRYRLNDGDIKFFYVIQQLDKVNRDAFDAIAESLREETDLPVYIAE